MDTIKLIPRIEIIYIILFMVLLKIFSALALTRKITYIFCNLNKFVRVHIKFNELLKNDKNFDRKYYFEVV